MQLRPLLQVSWQISEADSLALVQKQISSHFKFPNRSTNEVYEPLNLGQFSKVSKKHLKTINYFASLETDCRSVQLGRCLRWNISLRWTISSYPESFAGREKLISHVYPPTPSALAMSWSFLSKICLPFQSPSLLTVLKANLEFSLCLGKGQFWVNEFVG